MNSIKFVFILAVLLAKILSIITMAVTPAVTAVSKSEVTAGITANAAAIIKIGSDNGTNCSSNRDIYIGSKSCSYQ